MTTFKRNLQLGYGLSLLLLITSAFMSYKSITQLLNSAKLVNNTTTIAQKLELVISTLKDAETGQRGFLLTNDERFLAPYLGSKELVIATVAEVKRLTEDNSVQQADCDSLQNLVVTRMNYLELLINLRKKNEAVPDSMLIVGNVYMDGARNMINRMKTREAEMLDIRTTAMNNFAKATPLFILVASTLAILSTIVSFMRVLKDFNTRMELQQNLQRKEEETSRRLNIIDRIANQVASGNYKVTIGDEGKDSLGNIAGSLNKMAASLDDSFSALSEREWLQTGIANLNDIVIADQDIRSMSQAVLNFIAAYSNSAAGALYLLDGDGQLELQSGYALSAAYNRQKIRLGEGLCGQAALTAKIIESNHIAEHQYQVSYVAGTINAGAVIAVPLFFNKTLKGVIELAGLQEFSNNQKAFLEAAAFNTSIAINTAQSRQKVQELLEETQSQTEELQSQHSELENINAELEAQTQKLQTSEEELKVQQEELQQANSEQEERSRLLEEKNELILERNLQIQAKAEELEQSTKYKSEFLANMSHELRTPLNSILLLSRLLSENHESNLTADQVEYAKVIQGSGNGLLTLIDEILDLSKIEAGKMDLEYADVRIAAIVEGLQGLFVPLAKDKGIIFNTNILKDISSSIQTDRLRLDQILRNLLSNALKFTKKGSVTLSISQQDNAISFSVKDTGIGIPTDKQQTIFEAFQQADGSTRRQFGGTGLGLSISRELAKLLGGEIRLTSEEGVGSEFVLCLPVTKGAFLAAPVAIEMAAVNTAAEETEATNPEDYRQYLSSTLPMPVPDDRNNIVPGDKVILIIEDDTAFARALLDYTRKKGYKGIVSVRGDEAPGLALQYLPLGILLDIQLPVKSGWEVMDELKANPATRPIPVHMMSSHPAKTQSLSKGAIDFIDKPVAFEVLGGIFSKIEQALSRHPKKVVIVEENAKHAQALAYFLQEHSITSEINSSVKDCIESLNKEYVDCVILDMGMPSQQSYHTLEEVKRTPGLENVPIIIFTGKNLSHAETVRIRKYSETIVVKTAHSYERILDEVSLFLHLVEENKKGSNASSYKKMGALEEVLKGKTVLVADDDVRNIFSLTRALERYGMQVVSAIDGKEALTQIESGNAIDVVLMDMMMPEMDGYESIRQIRKIGKYKKLPIIAVTAKAMTGDREKCIDAGASDYVTKPVDTDQLISLLRVWLYQQ